MRPRPRTSLRFVFSRPYESPRTQWLIRVYKDVCAMIDVDLQFLDVPPKRATAMVQAGLADGELGRTFGYLELFPSLIRLSEPNNLVHFSVYSVKPKARLDNLQELRSIGLRCECRRGIPELESLLTAELGANNFSQISDVGQGLRKLQLGRTDLYFDVKEAVDDYLQFRLCHSGLPETPVVQNLATVLSTTGHCYLNQLHASLAPKMADALSRLKKDGTVTRYLEQCLQDYRQRCLASKP
jgi:polar amino acid transport system substrate-binding protein